MSGLASAARPSGTSAVTPADGRLRGQDFAAQVTSVAWPDQAAVNGRTVEAVTGHRFVTFTLQLAEDTADISPHGTNQPVKAALEWSEGSEPLSLASINDALAQQVDGSTWPTASQPFTVSVPSRSHSVALVLSQGSFSQTLNLWTLQRVPPAPTVLYRDPQRPTVTATTSTTGTLALSNPADGFSDTAAVSVQHATLSYFSPAGDTASPSSPSQAVLSVVLDGEYPNNPNDQTTSGHYLGAQSPLPATLLTFTPTGGSPVAATMSDAGDTTGKDNADDGLFDAAYSFVVPGNLTNGTLTVDAGTFSGTEFTLFTAESGNTTLDLAAALGLSLTFPPVPAAITQRTPPWVGAPLPPTVSAASSTSGGVVSRSGSGSSGFPIWLAVLFLVLLAAAVVLVQRWRRIRVRSVATLATLADPVPPARAPAVSGNAEAPTDESVPEPHVVTLQEFDLADPSIRVLGRVEVHGWTAKPERRVIEELLCFLVLHDSRPMSADQILAALRPVNGSLPEVSRKTFHTYLSGLRQAIGAEHLPDANAGGYQIVGVGSDWARFQALSRQADSMDGEESFGLRQAALSLVRGVPFEGVGAGLFEWVFNEQLASEMTAAIATCAVRLANDLFEREAYVEVDQAVRAGLRAAPDDAALWRIGAQALAGRQEGRALRRHLGDAERHLEPEELARIEEALGPHADSEDR